MREQGLDAEACDLLDAKATEVYTACSFQDLTGQRTRKVIGVLRYLEGRINAMIEIWGLDGALAAEAAEKRAVAAGKALLNGPARPGQGLDQADVDMVMGPAPVSRTEEMPPPIEFVGDAVVEVAAEDAVEAAAEDVVAEMSAADPSLLMRSTTLRWTTEPAIEVPRPRPRASASSDPLGAVHGAER